MMDLTDAILKIASIVYPERNVGDEVWIRFKGKPHLTKIVEKNSRQLECGVTHKYRVDCKNTWLSEFEMYSTLSDIEKTL